MRQKYIDERWPTLMIHGRHSITGNECVTDCNDRISVFMLHEEAEAMVQHYNKLHEAFSELAKAFNLADPTAFDAFWYGGEHATNA